MAASAIYTNSFLNNVNYGIFFNNTVKSDADGGAIYIWKKNQNIFSQCYFENNLSSDEGGAIYLDSNTSLVSLRYNIFLDNSVENKG